MPRINGGVVGRTNRSTFLQATGVWTMADIEVSSRNGAWPLATPNVVLGIAHYTTPYAAAYQWSDVSGFGTKYANPSTLPSGISRAIDFNPDATAVAIAHDGAPYLSVYPWSSSGFGTRFSNPATPPPAGNGYTIKFSPSGATLVVGVNGSSAYIYAYPWTANGFGTKYTDPSTAMTNGVYSADFNPSGSVLFLGWGSTPFIHAYRWTDAAGFGSRYTAAATASGGRGLSIASSPNGSAVIQGSGTSSPYINAYRWSDINGFGTKFTVPSASPLDVNGIRFNQNGDVVAMATSGGLRLYAWQWSDQNGFGTAYAGASPTISNGAFSTDFSPSQKSIALGWGSSPYINAYAWNATTGIGTKFTDPGTPIPGIQGLGVKFARMKS